MQIWPVNLIYASTHLLVGSVAVRSKAVILLLFIHCLLVFPLFVGFCHRSLFCFAVPFRFCNHLAGDEESWLLYFCCVLNAMSLYRSLTLPRGVMDWSEVDDYGISCLNSFVANGT